MSVPGVTPERHAACTGHDLERNTQGSVTYCFHKKIMGTLAYPANFGAVALVDAFCQIWSNQIHARAMSLIRKITIHKFLVVTSVKSVSLFP